MGETTLLISSRNYSSWCLRGWLLVRMAGVKCTVEIVSGDAAIAAREELLLRSSSVLVPALMHDGHSIWDTMAIAEYLNEIAPKAGMFPKDRGARARCRSISAEMHSGFSALRSALPMNLRSPVRSLPVWSGVQADIDRICLIWRDCLAASGGPWLFGPQRSVADAMFAPVATRFRTYGIKLDEVCAGYTASSLSHPDMLAWIADVEDEVEQVEELEVEF